MSAAIEFLRLTIKDFPRFAAGALKIRGKDGSISPLVLNQPQQYVHDCLERQLKATGKVRALILKGRQQGMSTYIEGRFMWRTTQNYGVRAFILTHEDEATKNLFEMAQRYYDNLPHPRPVTSAANAKELHFHKLDSGYRVGTAGNKAVGRSSTIQLFHGSEVAFWPNASEHTAGIMQAVPALPGTEIILESTANGLGGLFHEMWQAAERGESGYQAIFVPWFWSSEYREDIPHGFKLTEEESTYQAAYGLDMEQMAWRRSKIQDLGHWKFKQEYPATASEAFQSSTTDPFIPAETIALCRKTIIEDYCRPVLGIDPARFGDDRTAIVLRRGRKLVKVFTYSGKSLMEIAGIVAKMIKDYKPAAVFIDDVGLGGGVTDRLRELGHDVIPVNAGSRADEDSKYHNKRAEMWGAMLDWLKEGAQIPDSDELHSDLAAPQYSYDSSSRLKLEKKEDMKKRGLRSPDLADALALTFAYPVAVHDDLKTESAAAGVGGGIDGFPW